MTACKAALGKPLTEPREASGEAGGSPKKANL